MPSNVGSRKRTAAGKPAVNVPRTTTTRRRRYRGPYGALGGYGQARLNQVAVFNRKPVNVVRLKKTLYNGILQNGAGGGIGGTSYATANPVPDWTYMKTLFSHYRITRMKYVFTLTDYIAGDGKAFSNTRMPELFMRYNYDPNLAIPTTSLAMQELDNVVSVQFSPERTRFEYIVDPKQLAPTMTASGSATVGYRPIKPQWTNVADDTVQHWGLVYWVDYLDASFRLVADVEFEIELKSDK